MLVSLLLCSLPLVIPVLAPLLASLAFGAALASPGAPFGTVASFGSFLPTGTATVRRATEAAPPRGADGRFVRGPRTLPARDSRGRFLPRATADGRTVPTVY